MISKAERTSALSFTRNQHAKAKVEVFSGGLESYQNTDVKTYALVKPLSAEDVVAESAMAKALRPTRLITEAIFILFRCELCLSSRLGFWKVAMSQDENISAALPLFIGGPSASSTASLNSASSGQSLGSSTQ